MIEFKKAIIENIPDIQLIAHNTWPNTFGKVMPSDQIGYMLKTRYDSNVLKEEMKKKNHYFVLIYFDNNIIGFASYELNYQNTKHLMIHKAYLLPISQGKGIGRSLFDHLENIGLKNEQTQICLMVFYKNEQAIRFYKKNGYENTGIEETDIGNNFIIRDHVMVKKIK